MRVADGRNRLTERREVIGQIERGGGAGVRLRRRQAGTEGARGADEDAEAGEVDAGGDGSWLAFHDRRGAGRHREGEGGGDAGGEVGDEEGLADAGVADEERELAAGDALGPEPGERFGLDVGGVADNGVAPRGIVDGAAEAVEAVAGADLGNIARTAGRGDNGGRAGGVWRKKGGSGGICEGALPGRRGAGRYGPGLPGRGFGARTGGRGSDRSAVHWGWSLAEKRQRLASDHRTVR